MLTNATSYKHVQTTPSSTWIIEHGLSTSVPVIDCWVDYNGERIRVMPKTVEKINGSSCKITFTGDQVGFAVVA